MVVVAIVVVVGIWIGVVVIWPTVSHGGYRRRRRKPVVGAAAAAYRLLKRIICLRVLVSGFGSFFLVLVFVSQVIRDAAGRILAVGSVWRMERIRIVVVSMGLRWILPAVTRVEGPGVGATASVVRTGLPRVSLLRLLLVVAAIPSTIRRAAAASIVRSARRASSSSSVVVPSLSWRSR